MALSIGNDLLLKNFDFFSGKQFYEIFLFFFNTFTKSGYLCFIKYMLDRKYHHYWNVMLALGITLIVINSFTLLYIVLTPKESAKGFVKNFWTYFDKVSVGIIVSKYIIAFIFQFILAVFKILTVFYLTPEYIFITQTTSKIYAILLKKFSFKYIYINIIFLLLQFFSLMIYLEIIELNFLNLNKNIKRNIKIRMSLDDFERKDSYMDGTFESEGGYIFNNGENKQNKDKNTKFELMDTMSEDET